MRNLRTSKMAHLFFGLALALGVNLTAVAQNATPSSKPQASPPTQSNPAPDSQPQGRAQGQTQSQGPSVDDELQLTPDQKEKIAAVVDEENKQIGAVRDDTSLTMEQKQQKAREIRQAGGPRIKEVLTPEQFQNLTPLQDQKPPNPHHH